MPDFPSAFLLAFLSPSLPLLSAFLSSQSSSQPSSTSCPFSRSFPLTAAFRRRWFFPFGGNSRSFLLGSAGANQTSRRGALVKVTPPPLMRWPWRAPAPAPDASSELLVCGRVRLQSAVCQRRRMIGHWPPPCLSKQAWWMLIRFRGGGGANGPRCWGHPWIPGVSLVADIAEGPSKCVCYQM